MLVRYWIFMPLQTRFLHRAQALKLERIQSHASHTKTNKPKFGAYSVTFHIFVVIHKKYIIVFNPPI